MVAMAALPISAATIADSVADWSVDGTQGENGWFYGYYNLTNDADAAFATDDFQPFLNDGTDVVVEDNLNQWNGNNWVLYRDTAATIGSETGPWTFISQTGGHPNGTNSPAPVLVDEPEQAEHWAIRRWVSSYAGEVSAISTLAHTNTACGNGTSVELYQNGTLVDKFSNTANTPLANTVGLTLAVGDVLDFALTPQGVDGARGDSCDGSDFSLMITDDPPPPPVTPPMADSINDWSVAGVQGEKNWYNGYYNFSQDVDQIYQAADFIAFDNLDGPAGGPVSPDGNHWNGTQWDLEASGGPWTELAQSNTHPNGENSAPNEEHWTVRRYVANDLTNTTPVEITWEMAKNNLNGNGVGGVLFVNGEQVDTATIAGNDGAGVVRKFYVNANPGDVIDLALTPNGNDGSDGSRNRLTLRTDLPDGPLYNPGERVADSVTEFSGVQGQDNWFYGYYDLRADAEDANGTYDVGDFIEYLNDDTNVVTNDET
ncbi:MAG: hypothetical protein KDA92_16405, partial [Planctomycetales bacterium]|nr:hypothetical protein [Planctomycetales bacterium]